MPQKRVKQQLQKSREWGFVHTQLHSAGCPYTTGVCSQNPNHAALCVWVSGFDSLEAPLPPSRILTVSPASWGLWGNTCSSSTGWGPVGWRCPAELSAPCRSSSPPCCCAVAHHFSCQNAAVADKETKVAVLGTGYFTGLQLHEVFSQKQQCLSGLSEETKANGVAESRFKSTRPGKAAEVHALKWVGKLCINVSRDSLPCTAVGCSAELLHYSSISPAQIIPQPGQSANPICMHCLIFGL